MKRSRWGTFDQLALPTLNISLSIWPKTLPSSGKRKKIKGKSKLEAPGGRKRGKKRKKKKTKKRERLT